MKYLEYYLLSQFESCGFELNFAISGHKANDKAFGAWLANCDSEGGPRYHGDAERFLRLLGRIPSWKTMGMAEAGGEIDGTHGPINRGVVASKPGFSHDQIPSGESSNMESKVF